MYIMSHFSGNLRFKLQSSLKHYKLLVGTVRFNFGLPEPGCNLNQYQPQARHPAQCRMSQQSVILIILISVSFTAGSVTLHCNNPGHFVARHLDKCLVKSDNVNYFILLRK